MKKYFFLSLAAMAIAFCMSSCGSASKHTAHYNQNTVFGNNRPSTCAAYY